MASGKIPIDLIPPKIFRNSLNHIKKKVEIVSPNHQIFQNKFKLLYFELAHLSCQNDAKYFYLHEVAVIYKSLMVNYYQVISYPLPIPNSNLASQLINHPLTFGIDTDKQYYMESFIIQSWNIPFTADLENHLIPVSKPSCLLGIFTDNATSITQLCDCRVFRSPFESKIFFRITAKINCILIANLI